MSSPWGLTAAALQEPWRLWTGHVAHWGLGHALINGLACAVPIALLDRRRRRQLLGSLSLLLPLLGLVLLPSLGRETYRGASGVACLLWAAAGFGVWAAGDWRLGWTLLGLLALKLGMEAFFGAGPLAQDAGWRTLPRAHQFGALLGCGVGMAWRPWLRCGRAGSAAPSRG